MTPRTAARPERILALIDATGMTQRDLAQRLGVTPRYLRMLAKGERQIGHALQFMLETLANPENR